ncbi:HPr kinase/phosphorylase [Pseudodonghicola xiamenensis]|uniref:HPr kinase n=1 Tax=Pseudodonghicola xiamenensis TaxID=337702 RepID=A0A8J3ME40_9RHOB|nr:HPr kinase/phosphatase C-terminal domain-containing protein [Pseudodonghicola xiamenensis]GHH00623.1 HPr kinase [Pseudodonghicola xiamenensis]
MSGPPSETLHASCVVVSGRGLVIRGASGSGKSGLALSLMALGARLVSDDRTILSRQGDGLIASAPAAIEGLIEARGLGLLGAAPAGPAPVFALVDLDLPEDHRLPPMRNISILGCDVTLLLRSETPHFAASLMQFLRTGQRRV